MYGMDQTNPKRRIRRKGFPEGNLIVGYAWESCLRGGPTLEEQIEKMTDCHKVFQDKTTWVWGAGQESPRAQFKEMLKFLRDGDTLVIYSLDRLGIDQQEVIDLLSGLVSPNRGCKLRILDYDIDTTNPDTEHAVQMLLCGLGAILEKEHEREIHRKELARQCC